MKSTEELAATHTDNLLAVEEFCRLSCKKESKTRRLNKYSSGYRHLAGVGSYHFLDEAQLYQGECSPQLPLEHH